MRARLHTPNEEEVISSDDGKNEIESKFIKSINLY